MQRCRDSWSLQTTNSSQGRGLRPNFGYLLVFMYGQARADGHAIISDSTTGKFPLDVTNNTFASGRRQQKQHNIQINLLTFRRTTTCFCQIREKRRKNRNDENEHIMRTNVLSLYFCTAVVTATILCQAPTQNAYINSCRLDTSVEDQKGMADDIAF